ncbi:MAG: zinc-dependent metalloprotease [Planctomycetaceae bacterium]|nr:zinc-dependent metalloprotease [Planctomycetaceae bacterium]
MVRTFFLKNLCISIVWCVALECVLGCCGGITTATAEEIKTDPVVQDSKKNEPASVAKQSSSVKSPTSTASTSESSFEKLIKDTKRIEGLLPLYRKEDKLYIEVPNRLLEKEFFVSISIAQGIGDRSLLGGMSWGDGDDWVWVFRKRADKLQVVRKNVRFFAKSGSPEANAVANAFTDSILFSVPILAKTPAGGVLFDPEKIFFTDLPKISKQLSGFSFAKDRTNWASTKGFEDNVELRVAATYSSTGKSVLETVPDSRAATLTVHYSISLLPQNNYRPRLTDARVGYFVTALKNFSEHTGEERFVRYINRWHLEKADPKAEISPPKKPIVFWIERTVPYKYRQAIRDGISAWNDAYRKAGFDSAIEVRQQPDKTDWDPEDINFNTFRWITSGRGFAMGPSRVNPRTGQILDADIIFDADFVKHWRNEFETFTPGNIELLTGGHVNQQANTKGHGHVASCGCGQCGVYSGHAFQTALGMAALAATTSPVVSGKEREKLIQQGLKLVAMHEVGHTLGLRHNFKGSSIASLKQINSAKTRDRRPATTSVMDYVPVNIVPKGEFQGPYYPSQLGAYDFWAIDYGYRPVGGNSPESEKAALRKIASRSGESDLAFATDEDTMPGDPDPLSNRYDLGDDPIAFAQQRSKVVQELIPQLIERFTADDAGYERVRQAFGVLLSAHGQANYFASRLIGGLHSSRSHREDPQARAPFRVVDAGQQRKAMSLLTEQVFSDQSYQFPPEFYNQLVSTRWIHWGAVDVDRPDYPVHEAVLMWQKRMLQQLLDTRTLTRLADNGLKVDPKDDRFTSAELLRTLTDSIYSEVYKLETGEYSDRAPAISSLRRNLQAETLSALGKLALGVGSRITLSSVSFSSRSSVAAPDARSLANYQLKRLQKQVVKVLKQSEQKSSKLVLDDATRAHLESVIRRVDAILRAEIMTSAP